MIKRKASLLLQFEIVKAIGNQNFPKLLPFITENPHFLSLAMSNTIDKKDLIQTFRDAGITDINDYDNQAIVARMRIE
jgi:hypothetical protein